MNERTKDILFAVVAGAIALLAIFAMPVLVASPKLLFGRSLSAISPSLFPYVTLGLIAILSFGLILGSLLTRQTIPLSADGVSSDRGAEPHKGWLKKGAFFLILVAYGFLLKPFGFLISSFMAITLASLLLGNRHYIQVLMLAFFAPVCLYLVATRGMLVSLPELNWLELLYSQVIGLISEFVRS